VEFQAALAEPVGGCRVDLVFNGLNAGHQFVGVRCRGYFESALEDAGASVEFFCHEVHRAAVVLVASVEYSRRVYPGFASACQPVGVGPIREYDREVERGPATGDAMDK
jgi:hypothetical protein